MNLAVFLRHFSSQKFIQCNGRSRACHAIAQVRVALGLKPQRWPQDEWVWQYEVGFCGGGWVLFFVGFFGLFLLGFVLFFWLGCLFVLVVFFGVFGGLRAGLGLPN